MAVLRNSIRFDRKYDLKVRPIWEEMAFDRCVRVWSGVKCFRVNTYQTRHTFVSEVETKRTATESIPLFESRSSNRPIHEWSQSTHCFFVAPELPNGRHR